MDYREKSAIDREIEAEVEELSAKMQELSRRVAAIPDDACSAKLQAIHRDLLPFRKSQDELFNFLLDVSRGHLSQATAPTHQLMLWLRIIPILSFRVSAHLYEWMYEAEPHMPPPGQFNRRRLPPELVAIEDQRCAGMRVVHEQFSTALSAAREIIPMIDEADLPFERRMAVGGALSAMRTAMFGKFNGFDARSARQQFRDFRAKVDPHLSTLRKELFDLSLLWVMQFDDGNLCADISREAMRANSIPPAGVPLTPPSTAPKQQQHLECDVTATAACDDATAAALATVSLPTDLITLDTAAAMVNREKRTLHLWKEKAAVPREDGKVDPMPEPRVRGKKGAPHEYSYAELRPWLERQAGRQLPDKLPGA